jgi:hypothetical protein
MCQHKRVKIVAGIITIWFPAWSWTILFETLRRCFSRFLQNNVVIVNWNRELYVFLIAFCRRSSTTVVCSATLTAHEGLWKRSPYFTVCRFTTTLVLPPWIAMREQWRYIGGCLYVHIAVLFSAFQNNTNFANTVHGRRSHCVFAMRCWLFLMKFGTIDLSKGIFDTRSPRGLYCALWRLTVVDAWRETSCYPSGT